MFLCLILACVDALIGTTYLGECLKDNSDFEDIYFTLDHIFTLPKLSN